MNIKNLLNQEQVIRRLVDELKYNRTTALYVIKISETFPGGVSLPGYKKKRWREEDVDNWIEQQKKKLRGEG